MGDVTPETKATGKFREWLNNLPKTTTTAVKPKTTGGNMAGEDLAIKEGISMAKEVMPLLKDFFGMLGVTPQSSPSVVTGSPTVDASTGLLGVAKAIEDVAISLHEIAEALKK